MEILDNRKGKPIVVSLNTAEIEVICEGLNAFVDRVACSDNIFDQIENGIANGILAKLTPECSYQ